MAEHTHSEGWITFSAMMAGIAGGVNSIFGIALMYRLGPFSSPDLILINLYGFGVMLLSFGIAEIVMAVLLVRRNAIGRYGAMILSAASILMWSLWLGAYTTAALITIGLDILVIFGLSVTGDYFKS
jgi:hypothetical protein